MASTGCYIQTLAKHWDGIELDIGTTLALPVPPHPSTPSIPPLRQEIMMANVPGVNDPCPRYMYVQQRHTNQYQQDGLLYDSLSLLVLTHRPVSISVHDPNQYSGENPPQRHSVIPLVDVYIKTNMILCCQPLTNNRTSKRHPRERNTEYRHRISICKRIHSLKKLVIISLQSLSALV